MNSTELYLIRHAESVMNTQTELIGGRSNESPLTDKGITQARCLGQFMIANNIIPSRVFSSPAVRALQTCEYTLDEMDLDIKVEVDDALQEMDQGEWEGKPRKEIYTDEVLTQINKDGKSFKAPGGQSMIDVGLQVYGWLEDNIGSDYDQLDRSEKIFVFMHGLAIRCLASYIHNWDHMETFKAETPNASFSMFELPNGGRWRLQYMGIDPNNPILVRPS